jgi:phosphoribosylamine--glycine ligase
MKSDIVPFLLASAEGNFGNLKMEWEDKFSICVVVASGGYPGKYNKGLPISGPLNINDTDEDSMIFHAGTRFENDKILTSGGRVLGICVKDKDPLKARKKAIELAQKISFDGSQFRRDIGSKVI